MKLELTSGSFSETLNGEAAQLKAATGSIVTVKADDNSLTYTFASIAADTNVVANQVTIGADGDDLNKIAVTRGGASDISAIDVTNSTGKYVSVRGDTAFQVSAGSQSYAVAADLPDNNFINFNATTREITFKTSDSESYVVAGGNAVFNIADSMRSDASTTVTLNGATTGIKVGSDFKESAFNVYADKNDAGITRIVGLRADDSIHVANDTDGYSAIFEAPADSVVTAHTYAADAASINAVNSSQAVNFQVGADTSNVTITGLTGTVVTVAGGATYNFKDGSSSNKVYVAADDVGYVTLDGSGNVSEFLDSATKAKADADDAKWNNVATIGSNGENDQAVVDTVPTHRSNTLEQFYNLDAGNASGVSVASYSNDDASVDTVASATGYTFYGNTALGSAGHVTMTAGSAVGGVPINIQHNESAKVFDVTVNLTNSSSPSTVAIGTIGNSVVSASHEVYMSNAGVGYALVGSNATGQNKIFAGTAGSQIRHEGARATIQGNNGRDTIWGGKLDIVYGGAEADQFYDTEDYTVRDYNANEGDAIIATRLSSVDDVVKANINQGSTGNVVGFGTSRHMLTIGNDQNSSLNLKVAVMDSSANITATQNLVLAGQNGGALNASGLDAGAVIVADEWRNGNAGDVVVGSAYADDIYIGANDFANGGAGDDYITIGSVPAGDAGAEIEISAGNDTVAGWTFGFDRNAGATKLYSGSQVTGRFYNDRLMIYNENGSVLFEGTERGKNHGQWEVLVDENGTEKKFMAIRTYDENTRSSVSAYGYVGSNAEIADYYLAERDGVLMFGDSVTADLGWIELGGEKYQAITQIALGNNSQASVVGSSNADTAFLGGDAAFGAQKAVSLGAGNDVVFSGGDGTVSAGHKLFFGENDGRDTISGFSHYLGIDVDADKQYADTLVINNYTGLKVERASGGDRIEIGTGSESRVVIYETGDNAVNVNNMYRMQIGFGPENVKVAKIGFSDAANNFTYDKKVAYYVGNSGESPADTLTIADTSENVEVWLDGSRNGGEFYRGITVIDATAETNTNLSLVGGNRNDTINAGGVGTRNFMWGGTGDDVLNGGEGLDYFMYYKNSGAYIQGANASDNGGNDVVNGYDFNSDVIWLGDVTLSDLKQNSSGISDSGVELEFQNGGSLTVNTASDKVRVYANNGSEVYVADKSTGSWTREA